MPRRSVTAIARLSINHLFMKKKILIIIYYWIQIFQKLQQILSASKKVAESRFLKLNPHKGPLNGSKGVTDQIILTEKLMNKLQNLYGIALRKYTDKTTHQLKVALPVDAILYHSSELVKTECYYQFYLCIPDFGVITGRIKSIYDYSSSRNYIQVVLRSQYVYIYIYIYVYM